MAVKIQRILLDLDKNVTTNYKNSMIYIKRNRFKHIPGKWDVVNTKLKTHDITDTFRAALVYFLWHCGMSFRRAARLLKLDSEEI